MLSSDSEDKGTLSKSEVAGLDKAPLSSKSKALEPKAIELEVIEASNLKSLDLGAANLTDSDVDSIRSSVAELSVAESADESPESPSKKARREPEPSTSVSARKRAEERLRTSVSHPRADGISSKKRHRRRSKRDGTRFLRRRLDNMKLFTNEPGSGNIFAQAIQRIEAKAHQEKVSDSDVVIFRGSKAKESGVKEAKASGSKASESESKASESESKDSGEESSDEDYTDSGEDESSVDDEEREEYFSYDSSLLKKIIAAHISSKFGHLGLSQSQLDEAIEKSFQKAGEDLLEEYSDLAGNKPKDKRWKVGLTQEQIALLEPELIAIRKELAEELPTMDKILKAILPHAEKKRCVELFDILQNIEPYTSEHLKARLEIQSILRKQARYTPEEIEKMDRKEKEMDPALSKNDCMKRKIFELDCDEKVRALIYDKYHSFLEMDSDDSNYGKLQEWLERATNLPYRRAVQPRFDFRSPDPVVVNRNFAEFYALMDQNLYGLKRVKTEICQIANDRAINPTGSKSILALKSMPGQGKTRIAKVTADSLGLPFERISCGGMTDPSILKGSKRDWIGSAPSIILQILERAKYCNGIILIDELDKLNSGDGESGGGGGKLVQYALLHILDYTQNVDFRDSFLHEFGHDLSQIWWWVAFNEESWIDPTLRDRLYIVEIAPYTYTEKMEIAQNYVLRDALKAGGLSPGQIVLSKDGCIRLLTLLNKQMEKMGIRPIERELRSIVSRINFLRRVTLPDRTTGNLKLDYKIPNFDPTLSKPLVLTGDLIENLWSHETPDEPWRTLFN